MMFTFSIEGSGAIILFFCFLPEMHWTKALYYSIFHSISAFCNAGVFSVFGQFPEKDLAFSLAERLHNPNMLDYLPFSDDYTIAQISPPKSYIGKTLRDIDLINKFGVQIVAVKESATDRITIIPKAKYLIKENDILMILGKNDTLEQLRKVS